MLCISPYNLVIKTNHIPYLPAPFWNRIASVRINPPCDKFCYPAIRIRVTCGTNIRLNVCIGSVSGEHIEELVSGKVRQFIKPDHRYLRTLPAFAVIIASEVCKIHSRPAGKLPVQLRCLSWCCSTDISVKASAGIPQTSLCRNLSVISSEYYRTKVWV